MNKTSSRVRSMVGAKGVLVVFTLLLVSSSNGAKICGLDNYDTESVVSRDYWSFEPHPSQCANNNSKCTVYFTLCQALPSGVCGDTKNSGVCQKLIPNGDVHVPSYISLGVANDEVVEQDKSIGFQAFYPNGSKESEKCKDKPTEVIMFYTCNTSAIWNSTNGDITGHVLLYQINPEDTCQILINVAYSGACIKQAPDIPGCNTLEHFDLAAVRSRDLWMANVPLDHCKSPFTSTSSLVTRSTTVNPTCTLFFSFCQPLPNGICYDSIFCQKELFGDPVSFGKYNKDLRVEPDQDYTGFTIQALGGDTSSKCPNGFFSTFIFNCSQSADWEKKKEDGDITDFILPEPNADECEFNVILQYNGACTTYRPKPKSNSKESPVGGILIGIFFFVLIVYFLVGAIIQFARGKRGAEVIPNYKMWNTFFMLVLEGCQYTLDVITCFQYKKPGSIGAHKSDYESL